MARPASLALACFLLLGLGTTSSRADLVGLPQSPPELSAAERSLLAANPDLATLAETAPWALRSVLAAIGQQSLAGDTASQPGTIRGADGVLLERNPALGQMYRASPEAALELLALIKAAGSGKKGE